MVVEPVHLSCRICSAVGNNTIGSKLGGVTTSPICVHTSGKEYPCNVQTPGVVSVYIASDLHVFASETNVGLFSHPAGAVTILPLKEPPDGVSGVSFAF